MSHSMKGLSLSLSLVIGLIASASPAQRLPTGEYHANRERSYDLIHYKAEIRFDFEERAIEAVATVDLRPLIRVDTVSLDAIELQVDAVSLAGSEQELEFQVVEQSLVVHLPESLGPEDEVSLQIRYRCAPMAGMYFQPDGQNPELYFVTTYGEGGLHANWLPIYNDVNDRFSSEMVVTVPEPYVVISNGDMVGKPSRRGGLVTYHWLQERPHPNYLISLYVGDFERGSLEPALGSIPMSYWVPRGRLKEGAYAFRNTGRMVELFSQRFDYPYPWSKYDQIAVPDYAIGAMEHTGVTGHRASVLRREGEAPWDFGTPTFDEYHTDWTADGTIAHELAHHWFGNNVTCRNLSHLWLNESFATYLQMLWAEEDLGREQLLFDAELARRHYFDYVATEHLIRPLEYHYFDDPNQIYNEEHTYLKGAVVLHMLRYILGDDGFFRGLSHYLKKHELANTESHDLKTALEEVTGRNLDFFFEQWVWGGGHPVFEVSWRYLPDRRLIDVEVQQVQALVEGQGLFRLPVTFTIATAARTWKETVWVEKSTEKFLFSSDEEPLMVSFDGEGSLVAEIDFDKDEDELVYQASHDDLIGRLRALNRLVELFPTRPATLRALEATLSGDGFWALRAEAAQLLGEVRTPAAERLAVGAVSDPDYRIRKAAVLALSELGTATAEKALLSTIQSDAHSDVVGAAIVALARVNPEVDPRIIVLQLSRDAWHQEILLACLRAFEELARPVLVPTVKSYLGPAYNQDVRQAALDAWAAIRPDDTELHGHLERLAQSPAYALQLHAIEMLGRLAVKEASPMLERLAALKVDPNITTAAGKALAEIRRIEKGPAQVAAE